MTNILRRRWAEMRLAVVLLTRLPVGRMQDSATTLAEARWAFPFVGVIAGGGLWAILHLALALGVSPLGAAFLALGGLVLLTGGLHHDGLADFADGIGGGWDRERRLEIMRDSRIGSYGVLALIFAVGIGMAGVADLGPSLTLAAAIFVSVLSRLAMLGVLLFMPAARADGLGHAAADSANLSWVPAALFVVALGLVIGLPAAVVLAAMSLVSLVIARLAQSRIGGQTGDVLGAVQYIAETTGWLVLSATLAT
ncbi:adenosylcobinamide-GDP ribazoletransferase [Maritalea mobilis]|uniref:adenosylcobinamide-GDP ribazoletransferase n=1 Tax=Maritalea mobilis TaxID=483324 RepID=UPI001C97AA1E|nr:adenosylcobinamide-GDP ribazoletransferase [Maritalea mobilis]MBY6200974.1 adenosylcobinamide-GDP ribazoletransferase [Maritalea mobilis]